MKQCMGNVATIPALMDADVREVREPGSHDPALPLDGLTITTTALEPGYLQVRKLGKHSQRPIFLATFGAPTICQALYGRLLIFTCLIPAYSTTHKQPKGP